MTGVAVVRHVPRLLRSGAHAGAYGEKGEYARRARNGERPPEKRTGALVCPPKRVQIWDPLRRTESEGGRDLHSWHPARPPVRRNESLGGCLGGRRVLFVCMFGSASVCRAARAGGGLAVSASPLSNPAVAAPARAAQRRAAGSVPPMLLIGVSTAHSHHNHQLTDARCVTGGWLSGSGTGPAPARGCAGAHL